MTAPWTLLDLETSNTLPRDWAEHYSSVFFQHIQPQWPFMDEAAWEHNFAEWLREPNSLSGPSRFLIQVALSIGALVCSSFRPNCPHMRHSQGLYSNAMWNDLDELTRGKSMLLRTQGALLLLIHAFHGPSPDPIEQSLKLAMMNCVSLMSEADEPELHSDQGEAEHSRDICQRVVMSCHILNEVVSSGWTFPQDIMGEILGDKVSLWSNT